jgi:hypothetical protein
MKVKAAYFSGILFLFILLFSAARSSLAESFEVKLIKFVFKKETKDLEQGTSIPSSYPYSPSRDDMGVQGTFYEEEDSGVYEVIWSPPRDEIYIKRDLYIEVVLSGKYSSERKIKTLQYIYLQDTDNPAKPDDLGIHTWKLIANNIPYVGMSGGKLKFELKGSSAYSHISDYEKINQGNPRFRSIETVENYESEESKLIVLLDLERAWWTAGPDIEVSPECLNFSLGPRSDKTYKFVEIKNVGSEDLIVNYSITGANKTEFSMPIRKFPIKIRPGKEDEFIINYKPLHLGKSSAWLKISSNDPDEPVVQVPLIGRFSDKPLYIPHFLLLEDEDW